MNKIKKYIFKSPKVVLSFVLGAIVFSIIGVKAATILAASDVIYDNSSAQATAVQGALDELYTRAAKKDKLCKQGYYTTSTGSSNYTCTKRTSNQSVITLKLNGSGEQSFLSSSFFTLPNEIYIDGVSITPAPSYSFTSGGEHQVVMIWNSPINNMNSMFSGCSSLTSLDLSNFDASNVLFMNKVFYGCSSLTSLDLSNFDTSNVINMFSMFSGASSLTSLDLSSFNTSNVMNMNNMFDGCSSLTSLDISSFTDPQNANNVFSDTPADLKIKIDCNSAPNLQTIAGSKAVCVN